MSTWVCACGIARGGLFLRCIQCGDMRPGFFGGSDPVNSPSHYARLKPEPIDVIESWGLPFHESQVLKYIARAGHKDPSKHVEDLKKAAFYLKRRIEQLEKRARRAKGEP